MTYVDLEPDDYRDVQVQHRDGNWYTGELAAHRKPEGMWEGYVGYTLAPSETYLGCSRTGRTGAPVRADRNRSWGGQRHRVSDTHLATYRAVTASE